jgi:thymidylate kinase
MRPRASAGVFGLLGYLYGLASYAALRLTQRTVDIVVCDRYFYQFFYDLYGPSAWKVAGAFPRPDLVVWLDVGPEALADRLRGGPDGAEMSYLTSVIEFYRRAAETLGFRRIDGGAQETQVAEAIWRTVTEDMGRWHA